MIYIHVPFCHRKCSYCAFYSKPLRGGGGVGFYVDALLDEMERRKGEQAHTIKTVYFGGGTPSILPLEMLSRIVDGLHRCFDLSAIEEMTVEANPEDLSPGYLEGLRRMGFDRLSIGVQSLDDGMLRLLNRRHTARQAIETIENAHRAGFGNISVDFIYGLPVDVNLNLNLDLNPAFDFQLVNHVSAYALTVEPGTALAVQVEQGRVVLPGDDEVVRQYHALYKRLESEGFRQYEVSNYARPGCESKHNSRYWDRTPYLGLGPGAHSFDGRHRKWNNPDGTVGEETLGEADAYNELLMTALRTVRGLDLALVPERQIERLHRLMQPYVDCGWIAFEGNSCRPTVEGLLHADGMAAALFV